MKSNHHKCWWTIQTNFIFWKSKLLRVFDLTTTNELSLELSTERLIDYRLTSSKKYIIYIQHHIKFNNILRLYRMGQLG
jgi:hypothetical protein